MNAHTALADRTASAEQSAMTAPDSTGRSYLMCTPTYFEVRYAINPWMSADALVDHDLATTQWTTLRDTYRALGHQVEELAGVPDQPDMVFAANSGTMVNGRLLAAKMFAPERTGEQAPYRRWFAANDIEITIPTLINEGEGDFTWTGEVLLCGSGFRSDAGAHLEAERALGIKTVALQLVSNQFYHLDTALFVIDSETVAYYPPAFSAASQDVLAELFPTAIIATEQDAMCLGLNAVSDGRHVVIAPQATDLIAELDRRGYQTVPVDMSEFAKAGGGIKCCTLELRR